MNKKILFSLLLAIGLIGIGIFRASAQQSGPQFLITWSAKSYAPSGFTGKLLPTANSPITVSFELLDGGKIVDLSGKTIYWYLNDEFVEGTAGQRTINVIAPTYAPNAINLRVQIQNYKGSLLFQEIDIPVVPPEAVIESSFPSQKFTGSSLRLSAAPYFFNVSSLRSLNFQWGVNGQTPLNAENPQNLTINLNAGAPLGSNINVDLSVQNPRGTEGGASVSENFTYTK